MKSFNGVEILETLPEILRPSHTALVVWDVQNGLVRRSFNREEFLSALASFIPSLRGKIPVFYTRIALMPPQFQSGWAYYSRMRLFNVSDPAQLPPLMAPGTDDGELAAQVRPQPGDVVIEKSTPNLFLGTNFELMARNRGIKSLIFTGIATEIGVELSARDAAARGFYPVVVSDGVSSMNREAHERSLANLARVALTATAAQVKDAVEGKPL